MYLSKKWLYVFFSITAVAFLSALVSYAYIGFFTRYWYDDFCTAGILKQKGFIDSQAFWYMNWSGRFTYHVVVNIAELIGTSIVPFLPILALLIWVAVSVWAIYQLLSIFRFPFPLISSFLTALVLVFSTLSSTPDIVQSLYWQTGMLTYLAPLILLTIWMGVLVYILRKHPQKKKLKFLSITGFVISFLSSGLSETYAILQIGILAILLVLCLIYFSNQAKGATLPLILSGLLGAVLSFSIVFIAPGNKSRQSSLPASAPLISVIKPSFFYTLNFAERHSRRSRPIALLNLIFPAWLILLLYGKKSETEKSAIFADINTKTFVKLLCFSILIGFSLMFICFVPAFYALSETLPLRAQILPKFILVNAMMFVGFSGAVLLLNVFSNNKKFKPVFFVLTSTALEQISVNCYA